MILRKISYHDSNYDNAVQGYECDASTGAHLLTDIIITVVFNNSLFQMEKSDKYAKKVVTIIEVYTDLCRF